MSIPKLKLPNILTTKLDDLNPAAYNPRKMTKGAFDGLKASLMKFGLTEPLIINKNNTIVGGHMRYEAIKELWGLQQEVIVSVVDLSPADEKKLNIALNNLEIQGRYDKEKLAELLEEFRLDDDYDMMKFKAIEPLEMKDPTELDLNKEVDINSLTSDTNCKCPRCGFEWEQ